MQQELGQAARGDHAQPHAAPALLIAAMREIQRALDNAQANVRQEEYDASRHDPFANTGARFECEAFQVQAYDWTEGSAQKWNFQCDGVQVRWYKWFARSVTVNAPPSHHKIAALLDKCLAAIEKWEADNDEGD